MMRRPLALLLLVTAALGACETDDPPSQWEIIQGNAALELSAAVHPDTRASLATYPTRTGSLTIGEDSSTSGWIRIAAGDTVYLDGTVTREDGDLVFTFDDLVPAEYRVITRDDFPDTYALISTAIIYSDVTGSADPENHRIYWQFTR
jgi:hypothetical protein